MVCAAEVPVRDLPPLLLGARTAAAATGILVLAGRLAFFSCPLRSYDQIRNYSSGYMEQATSRGYEASPQSGLGVGWELCSSSKKVA